MIAKDKVVYLKPRGYQPEVQSVTKQRELKAPLRVPKIAGVVAEDAECRHREKEAELGRDSMVLTLQNWQDGLDSILGAGLEKQLRILSRKATDLF